jgi:hypothetical protein
MLTINTFCPRLEEASGDLGSGGGGGVSTSTPSTSSPSTSTSAASASQTSALSLSAGSIEDFLLGGSDEGTDATDTDSTDSSTDLLADATETPDPSAPASTTEETEQPVAAKDDASEGQEWDPEVGAPDILKDSKGKEIYQWSKARGERIYHGYKAAQQYQEIAPTVEDARTHQQAFVEKEQMMADFSSGEPDRVENFLAFLNKTSPAAMPQAMEILAKGLPTGNPEAYKALRNNVISSEANSFYADAKRLLAADPNSQDGQKYLFAAQTLDFLAGRPFRQLDQVSLPSEPDARETALAAREAEIKKYESQRSENEWKQFEGGFQKTIQEGFKTQISEVFDEPLKALKAANPKMYDRAVTELREEVRKGMAADQNFSQLYKLKMDQLRSNRNDAAAKALRQQYLGRTRIEVAKRAGSIIKDYSTAFVAANAADHAKLKQSAARKEVQSGAGASGSKGIALDNQRYAAAKTVDDKVNALFGL